MNNRMRKATAMELSASALGIAVLIAWAYFDSLAKGLI